MDQPTERELIAAAAEASEYFGDDECEWFARELHNREERCHTK
jgi:hypothetical protein